jgi:NADPH2:quinone reductase
MKAIEISQPGGPDVLQISTLPVPSPGPGEVLIKVAAAGVNRPDVLQRKGLYPPPPGAPNIPGLEVAGTVVGLGLDVHEIPMHTNVAALVAGGGYAEYCVAPVQQCLPIPKGLSFVEAASLPEAFFTVWSNVYDRCKLAAGESLLVQGGSSGIGVAAIQLAHALGNPVYATAGSAEKCAACERLGAVRAINYKNEDFVTVIKAATGERGVDVILDMVGGDYVAREIAALADDGRLVFIGAMGGIQTTFSLRDIITRRLTLTGSTLRSRSTAFKGSIAQALLKNVWPLIEEGKIKAVIYKTFPLEEAASAHQLMESSEHIGKIMLIPTQN